MPSITIFITDQYDTEYDLQVDFDIEEADPSVGIMSPGAAITHVKCDKIKMHTAGESKTIWPLRFGMETDVLSEWIGQWCLETFEKQIQEKLQEAAANWEPDYPEYE